MLNLEHEKTTNPDNGNVVLTPPNRYLWLTYKHEDIYYQDGDFYTGCDTPALDWREVPSWAWGILRENYTKETRDMLNIVLPENRKLTDQEESERKEERKNILWKCDKCGESVTLDKKGVHLMDHTNAEKREEKKLNKGGSNAGNEQTANGRKSGKENSSDMAKNV